jgi:hypothetical protein
MNHPDPSRWSDYSGSLRAVLDEYSRAIRDYESVMLALPIQRYTSKTSLSDDEFKCIQDIARHVAGAAHSYAYHITHALDKLDGPIARREVAVDTPEMAVKAIWEAFDHMVEVLRRIKGWSDGQQAEVRFVSRWKQPYDIEQMLEHAIVHILRHRRQLQRWRDAPVA